MKTFEKKWNGMSVQDDGAYMSRQAKSFITAFKNMLRRELPDSEITVKAGHYELFGFVTINGRNIFISYDIPRWGRGISFDTTGAMEGVLYRAAKTTRDYHGGRNHFCSIRELPEQVRELSESAWFDRELA